MEFSIPVPVPKPSKVIPAHPCATGNFWHEMAAVYLQLSSSKENLTLFLQRLINHQDPEQVCDEVWGVGGTCLAHRPA